MEHVRAAGPDDRVPCAALLAGALAELDDQRDGALAGLLDGPSPWPPDPATLVAAWAADADGYLAVGTIDDVVVGLAAGRTERRGERLLGLVTACYVEREARGIGVGTALLGSLVEWFAGRGCTGVDAPALPGDRATKQLYEGAGFKARLLVLHRPLG
ncbi:MAG TPA: GNAT family N-acetyltransferase [Acidimicrobiales bacterium]|nr:GNAT family N-acetyltransferase [Acidimicrobiales bacterium]